MLRTILILLGGAALLLATMIDTLAVIGRHIGLPINGSIELMQAAVMISGAAALVISLWDDAHARVHLLLDRLGPSARRLLDQLSDGITLIFLAALLAGAGWLAADLWHGHEQSELLGVPWAALRAVANVALAMGIAILGLRLLRKRRA
ncbi:MAG: TRAP transporter small permease subunit [Alteraurantiacibacter sp.]